MKPPRRYYGMDAPRNTGPHPDPTLEPHDYTPSTLHMGDCDICGHLRDAPHHRVAQNLDHERPTLREALERIRDFPFYCAGDKAAVRLIAREALGEL